MANSVTFPSSIGGDDNTYTDDNNPDTGLAGGGAVVRLIPMFSNVVNIANYVITVGSNAVNAPATNATSTTSLTIGTGSKSLTLAETGKLFYIGQTVSVSDTTGLNVMSGTITAFNSGTGAMTVNVTNAIGTGTITSWIISVGALSATSTGTSLVKGNGTGGFSAASVRTDYAEPTTALATGLLKNTTTTGAHTIAVAGVDYVKPDTATVFTIAQDFTASGITLKGSSTGKTTFTSANASATNYTITFPASTGTVLTSANAVTVAQGGTGATTLTGLIKGNGTGAFTTAAVTDLPITGAASTITASNLTASRALTSNASGKVEVSAVTSTELGYLSGVTSAIQTQLAGKQAVITGGATTITAADLTPSKALASGASGKVSVATTTLTELNYLSGVTSAIQGQLNGKQALGAYAMLGANTFTADQTINGVKVGLGGGGQSSNLAVGYQALNSNISGAYNCGIGFQALHGNTAGTANTGIGTYALMGVSGSGNVMIGAQTSSLVYDPAYNITSESNRISIGSQMVTNAYVQVAWTAVSDARDKTNFSPIPYGLDFVNQLKPISYQFRESRDSDITNGGVKYGFKAQDILELEGENSVIIDSQNPEKLYYTSDHLIPVLVKAIQELTARVVELENR